MNSTLTNNIKIILFATPTKQLINLKSNSFFKTVKHKPYYNILIYHYSIRGTLFPTSELPV